MAYTVDVTETTLINLTPHDVVVLDESGVEVLRVAPQEQPARLVEVRGATTTLRIGDTTISVVGLGYLDVVLNLPDPQDGVKYIVSRVPAQGIPPRDDLLFPIDEVRDAANQIIGCRAFGSFKI